VFGALFSALASKLAAAPDAVGVESLALLAEAQIMAGDKAKLPDQVGGSVSKQFVAFGFLCLLRAC
jgi:hypothetical protein